MGRRASPSPFGGCAASSLSRREREGAPKARKGEGDGNGFTLIEVMVALAVFALAVLALVRLESATLRGAATIDETLAAAMVARSVAAEAMTDARPPTLGTAAGSEANGGRDWRWTRTVAPTADSRVLRIDVTVADARGVERGRATLVRSTIGEQ